MKKIIYLLLITVLFTVCKKKKNVNPQPDNPKPVNQNWQISKIEFGEGSDKATITLDYDDKGDVVKIGDEKTKLAKTYIYSKQRIVSKEPIGDDIQITTYSLDDSGKITSAAESFSKKPTVTTTNITYKYTDDGYLSRLTANIPNSDGITKSSYTYTWQNGNITVQKRVDRYGDGHMRATFTIYFQYGTEAYPINFKTHDVFNSTYVDFALMKYFGKAPKNLTSFIVRAESKEEYTYQKDDKGNVTKVSGVFKTPKEKDESFSAIYHYNCN